MYSVVLMAALTAGGRRRTTTAVSPAATITGAATAIMASTRGTATAAVTATATGSSGVPATAAGAATAPAGGRIAAVAAATAPTGAPTAATAAGRAYNEVSPYFVEPPPGVDRRPRPKPDEALPPPTKPGDTKPPEAWRRPRPVARRCAGRRQALHRRQRDENNVRASHLPDAGPGAGTDYYYEARGVAARRQAGERRSACWSGPARKSAPTSRTSRPLRPPRRSDADGGGRNRTAGEGYRIPRPSFCALAEKFSSLMLTACAD